MRKTPARIESVHRALTLLRTIIDKGSIGVTEAAHLLDVNVSTAQRLLATLVLDDFASQGKDRRYGAGPALSSPGLATHIPQITDELRPALESLFDQAAETVHIAALYGTRILHLDGIESRSHALRFGLRLGVWLPAHVTASGKAMLADFSDEEVMQRYAEGPLHLTAQQATVHMPSLLAELDEVRRTRVALNLEGSEPGIAALSTSLGERHGQRMAISVALPSARYSPELGEKWAHDLIEVADRFVDAA